jgi:hypothetical protein
MGAVDDYGHGTWVFEGSKDDSSYSGLGNSFTLGGAAMKLSLNLRYYRFRQTTTLWHYEIEFKI